MKSLNLVSIWIGLAAAAFAGIAQASVLYQHQGDADPVSEGFSPIYCCGGSVTAAPIANDLGLPAWSVSGSAQSTQYGYYSGITSAQKADIASQGFVLSLNARVLPGIAPAYDNVNYAVIGGAVLATATKRFDIQLGLDANGDTVAVLPTHLDNFGGGVNPGYTRAVGPSYTLTDSGSSHHNYSLVYDPTTQLADLFVDGVDRIHGYAGFSESGLLFDYGLTFAVGSGGQANFNLARLETPQSSQVPLPSSWLLLLSGVASLYRLRRNQSTV